MKTGRRRLLQQAGLWSVLAPFARPRRSRATTGTPRRLIVLCSPNGPQHRDRETGEPRRIAHGTERDFVLDPWWAPLERHKDLGVFFRSMYQAGLAFGESNYANAHVPGSHSALTARTSQSTGPSIDQFVGQQLLASGVTLPHRSLLFGLYDRAAPPFFEGRDKPLQPETNPYAALAALAPGLRGDEPSAMQRDRVRQHFILDHVAEDARRLRGRLGGEGRAQLDFHLSNIEALEASLGSAMTVPGCTAPDDPGTALGPDTNWTDRETRDEAMGAFTELTALSFACDLTRVVGIGFGSTGDRFHIPSSYEVPYVHDLPRGADSGDRGEQMHGWSHQAPGPETDRAMSLFYNWFSEKVAQLIDKLKATPDADGQPLMDSTVVMWTSEMGAPGGHSYNNTPVCVFGNACGDFETGRLFDADVLSDGSREGRSLPLHNLFVSLIRHTGLTHIDEFGNAGRGPLDWLSA